MNTKYNKKVIIIVLVSTFLIISGFIGIESGLFGLNSQTQSNSSGGQGNSTTQSTNFGLSSNLSMPSKINMTYISYKVCNMNFTETSANSTIKQLFGNISGNVTRYFKDEENGYYDYWVPGGVYGIKGDDYLIYYSNHSALGYYSEKEIQSNTSLYNLSQSNSFSDNYIKERIGINFSLFTLEKSVISTIITTDGEYIRGYEFTYSRRISNMTVNEYLAGWIRTKVSPDGTLHWFTMYFPTLKQDVAVKPIDPTLVINIIDANFDLYRANLTSGCNYYNLSKIQLSYGISNKTITIGWEVSFISGKDGEFVSSVFVS